MGRVRRGRVLPAVGGFLGSHLGWMVGVVLTVVGSTYLAGTLWSGLTPLWRAMTTLGFLGVYAIAFSVLGERIGRQPHGETARGWLAGVSAALAPVHAMAVGALWSVEGSGWIAGLLALPAVVGLHGWLLRRSLAPRTTIPGATPALPALVALLVADALAPLVPAGLWAILATAVALVGVWRLTVSRCGATWSGVALLAWSLALGLLVVAPLSWTAWGPVLALAALAALYLDTALGRVRGLYGVGLHGVRGVVAACLGLGAFATTLPTLAPLPQGPAALATFLLVGGMLAGAALAWRRPGLLASALTAGLLGALAIPSVAATLVGWFTAHARSALGYASEPLPLAWYASTLLPLVVGARVLSIWLAASSLRQGPRLAAVAWRWAAAVSLLLLGVAHTRVDDPRPAVLALVAYAVLWLGEARVRTGAWGLLPWAGALLLAVDMARLLAMPTATAVWLVGGLLVSFPVAGAAWATRHEEPTVALGARIVAVAAGPVLLAAAIVGGAPAEVGLGVWGLLWWTLSGGDRVGGVLAAVAPGLVLLAVGLAVPPMTAEAHAWVAVLAGVTLLALASVHRRRGNVALARSVRAWGVAAVAFVIVLRLRLEGLDRIAVGVAAGALLLALARSAATRFGPVYGAVLALGVAEGVTRRIAGTAPLSVALLAGVAAVWLLAVASARSSPWCRDRVAAPARLVGSLGLGVVTGALALAGVDQIHELATAAGVVALAALFTPSWAAAGLALVLAATAAAPFPWLLAGVVVIENIRARGGAVARASLVVAGVAALALGPTSGGLLALLALVTGSWVNARGAMGVPFARVALAGTVLAAAWTAEALARPGLPALLAVATIATLLLAGVPRLVLVLEHGLARAADDVFAVSSVALALAWTALFFVGPVGAHPAWLAALVAAWAARGRWSEVRAFAPVVLLAILWTLAAPIAAVPWVLLGWFAVDQLLLPGAASGYRRGLLGASAIVVAGLVASGGPSVTLGAWWSIAGLLLVRTGAPVPFAWVGLGLGLITAAVPLDPDDPFGVASWAALAGSAVAVGMRAERRGPIVVALACLPTAGLLVGSHGAELVLIAAGALLCGRRWGRVEHTPTAGVRDVTLTGALLLAWVSPVDPLASVALVVLAWVAGGPVAPVLALAVAAGIPGALIDGLPLGTWTLVVSLAATGLVLLRRTWARGHRDHDGQADLALVLATAGWLVGALLAPGPGMLAAQGAALAPGWWRAAPRVWALAGTWLAIQLTLASLIAPWTPTAAAATLAIAVIARRWRFLPLSRALRAVLGVQLVVGAVLDGQASLALVAIAAVVEVGWTLGAADRRRWAVPLGWMALAWVLARTVGPLTGLTPDAELGWLVAFAMVLEAGALAVARLRGPAFADPLLAGAAALPLVGILLAAIAGGVPWAGLGASGTVFLVRFVVRGRRPDLAVGLLLVDASVIRVAMVHGWSEPLAVAGPLALSVLVLAQHLRGSADPRVVLLLRYGGAVAITLTAWVDALGDPSRTLLALVLALGAMGAGALLRVRAFLVTGSAFLLAVLGTNLLRFGLEHGQFWALYLTLLGLLVLGIMVVSTVYARQLRHWRLGLTSALDQWE